MEGHMYTIYPEPVDAFGFAAIGRDMPYEVVHHDNLESVLGLSGHDGTVLQTISYDPFGNTISTTGSSNNNQLHYTGREQDPDTGLYNYRNRTYDPSTGTFTTEDPKGFAAGVNFYIYALNNPINANDPYGFTTLAPINPQEGCPSNASCMDPGSYIPHFNPYYIAPYAPIPGMPIISPSALPPGGWVGGALKKLILPQQSEPLDETTSDNSGLQILLTPPPATPSLFDKYSNPNPASNTSFDLSGFSDSGNNPAASGGFLIYPNKPNTNMMQSVYKK